ncbi:Fic family protein [bacterium]|nr:Fic family protein [bacterium]
METTTLPISYEILAESGYRYQQSHPWISFKLDLQKASPRVWLLLGEAQSKCEHIRGVPLLPAVQDQLNQIYLAKGALATTAIEGNTLTEAEVLRRLRGQLDLPPSKEYLGQEVDNILEAFDTVSRHVLQSQADDLHLSELLEYNRLVLQGLPQAAEIRLGAIKVENNGVGNYLGAPPEECEHLLTRLCEWLNQFMAPNGFESFSIAFGILKALVAHVYIAWIHPFDDGNGRTARLVEYRLLLAAGIPATAAQLLSNHYNQTRTEYYRQLDRTSRGGGDLLPFIEYALRGFVDQLKQQVEVIQAQQLHVHWINHIHNLFHNQDSTTDRRKRQLALALNEAQRAVPIAELRYLTPKLAEAYAGRTDKTLRRDVNDLVAMGLVRRWGDGFEIDAGRMRGFLPASRST